MIRAALLLIASTVLCNACAVGAKNLSPLPPVQVVRPADCPAPERPELPSLDASLPLDHPANIEALMSRDDILRHYIGGLEAAVKCHEEQTAVHVGATVGAKNFSPLQPMQSPTQTVIPQDAE